jgi:hypothetical protein
MAKPRLSQRVTFWAPRALVVISCALALLAVQPATGMPAARSRPVALKETGTSASRTSWEVARRMPAAAVRSTTDARHSNESVFAAPQRLHILATVDILQRLLLVELQPASPHVPATLWLWSECPTITLVPLVARDSIQRPMFLTGPQPEAEKSFAMAHCQLAPPRI